MRILIATDAWPPQVNGVVRSLQSLAANARKLGAEIEFLTPERFRSFPLPTYPSIRCAIPTWREIVRRIELVAPDALHIATEGPIGHIVRRYCLVRKITFTTSYMTRFPEYVSARLPVPLSWTYALLRCFHAAAGGDDGVHPLINRGARQSRLRPSGDVDTRRRYRPLQPRARRGYRSASPDFCQRRPPRGGKESGGVSGARSARLEARDRRGAAGGRAAASLSQCPLSRSAGRGNLGGASCGGRRICISEPNRHLRHRSARSAGLRVPVAAYPVPGPRDVIGSNPVGVLDEDLKSAGLKALTISRAACRAFALTQSWEQSARQFISHCRPCPRLRTAWVTAAAANAAVR